ncbi:MAG: iron-containing alcohol dehydrogenase [Halioglobus sp.]
MDYQDLSGNWNYPTSIVAGAGAIGQLAACATLLGMKAPLLITDPGLAALPMVEEALAQCRSAGLEAAVFCKIKSNPTGQNVLDGVEAYQDGKHDGVIAFGGGSAIDAAKVIALMVHQTVPLWEFENMGDNLGRFNESAIPPIIAVPTTAGTGSEVGRAALITDEARQVKQIFFHPNLLPSKVILDPELTIGLPASITAATGMDALSHNLEALCSNTYHPMSEGIAMEGIRLVSEYLPEAVANGGNVEARMQMIVASSMGATAFQKGLGAMHALAHPLGALYDAHHGLLNAILMPYVLQANRSVIADRIERLARYINIPEPGFDTFLQWVLDMRTAIGIPHSLSEIGIDDKAQQLVGEMAVVDPTAGTNAITFSAEQYSQIFVRAVSGNL